MKPNRLPQSLLPEVLDVLEVVGQVLHLVHGLGQLILLVAELLPDPLQLVLDRRELGR